LKTWSYSDYRIQEGLKPEAQYFQYFYAVFEGDKKICSYCVWIDDNALSKFDPSRNVELIADSHKEEWGDWVKGNLDRKDFRNLVLKYAQEGKEVIDLNEKKERISPE